MTDDCGNGFPTNSENIYGSTTVLILIVESKSCMFIFSFLFTGENGKTIMKPVYPLRRKKKIGKSKIDIDFQFSIFNWKLNGRMTHGTIWAHLRCHRHFFHSSFYSSFSFSWEKHNVIFLHCNRNTRPNKIEADDSNCTVIYCIFISGLVSFPLWVQKKKNENWPQIFIFHFSEKIKIWHRFSFFIFLCSEKNKNCT